jgi:Flp pilus assembly protein TadD
MRLSFARALVAAILGLSLAGCSTSNKFSDMLGGKKTADVIAPVDGTAAQASADTTGSIGEAAPEGNDGLLGSEAGDDLSLGKKAYRANNFGMAERYFRRAAESHPRDAEAWLGLAAAYDRLRRFDLADRAYAQAIGIVGPTPEIMNNQGFSYMLRGDYARARTTLLAAQRRAPANKFVANNLRLLDSAVSKGKAVQ